MLTVLSSVVVTALWGAQGTALILRGKRWLGRASIQGHFGDSESLMTMKSKAYKETQDVGTRKSGRHELPYPPKHPLSNLAKRSPEEPRSRGRGRGTAVGDPGAVNSSLA